MGHGRAIILEIHQLYNREKVWLSQYRMLRAIILEVHQLYNREEVWLKPIQNAILSIRIFQVSLMH